MDDLISRQAALNALWKALYEYEDKTAKQFQESEDLNVEDWMEHRIFIQNMNDIDRQEILSLPSAEKKGKWMQCERVNHHQFHPDCPISYSVFCCTSCLKENDRVEKYCPNCGAKMEVQNEAN